MKSSTIILLSTFSVLASFNAGFAEAAAKKARPSQTASMTNSQAMYQCASQYAGYRGYLARDRYAYIEGCFKILTGKYPSEVGENCPLRRC